MKLPLSRKRLAGLAGLGALALAISGCSPGSATINASGSDASASDHIVVSVTCGAVPSLGSTTSTPNTPSKLPKNCRGIAFGKIGGQILTSTALSGGFTDLENNGADCTSAPCSKHAEATVFGLAMLGGNQNLVEVTADDNSPAVPGAHDTVQVSLYDSALNERTLSFTCTNNCVTVRMRPGSLGT